MMSTEFIEYRYLTDRYLESITLRNEILRQPIGLDLRTEDLRDEVDQRHFGLLHENRLVACVVIKLLVNNTGQVDRAFKLRQMCVQPDLQSMGLGRVLIESTEQALAVSGLSRIELAARLPAVPFYQRMGFEVLGDEFIEVTIPHRKMIKTWGSTHPPTP
jgi:hypothetical protein